MEEYEIRLLNAHMRPIRSNYIEFASDDKAVSAAKEQSMGQAVEVWRDSVCIYRAPSDEAHRNQH